MYLRTPVITHPIVSVSWRGGVTRYSRKSRYYRTPIITQPIVWVSRRVSATGCRYFSQVLVLQHRIR